MLEYLLAWAGYLIPTYALEYWGIKTCHWKYKSREYTAGSMVWLACTYIFMLGLASLFTLISKQLEVVMVFVLSLGYCVLGVMCDESMDVWEELNVGKFFNFNLYLFRVICGYLGYIAGLTLFGGL